MSAEPLRHPVRLLQANSSHCPFCGSPRLKKSRRHACGASPPQRISVVECPSCVAAWQWPVSDTEAESIEIYDALYAAAQTDSYYDPQRRQAIATMQMDWIEGFTPARGSLLDVGAGDGTLIREAVRRGWKATGIEPSAGAVARFDPGGTNAQLIHGTLESASLPDNFDVVTMMDVIEHVEDGMSLLAQSRQRVAPGGVLVVETGNYCSADRVEAGNDWWCFQIEHRWYYSPGTLSKLLTECGFRDIRFCLRCLRPWADNRSESRPPSWKRPFRQAFSNPSRTAAGIREYRDLQAIARQPYSGIEIMAVAARL